MSKKFTSTFLLSCMFGILFSQVETEKRDSVIKVEHFANLIGVHWDDSKERILTTDTDKIALGQWDPTRRLQGRTAGLNVYANSYTAGASSKITFRGLRSIQNSNQPLILLNGMPINNTEWGNGRGGTDQSNRLIDIDPMMVESIDFQSSMSARAKHGIVGANGVISIKTKKGFKIKPQITFSSTVSRSELTNMYALQYEYAQGRTVNGVQMYRGPDTAEGSSWGPLMTQLSYDSDIDYPYDVNGSLSTTANGQPANVYDPLDFFTNGFNHNQSLQVLGGLDKLSYLVVGSFNSQRDAIATNQHNRLNLGTSIAYQPSEKLELQLTANVTNSNAQRNQKGSNLSGIMLGVLRTPVNFDNTNGLSDPLNSPSSYILADGSHRSYRKGIYDNPYWSLNRNPHNDKVNRQIYQVTAKYNLLSNLDLKFKVGADMFGDTRMGGIDNSSAEIFGRSGFAYERSLDFDSQNLDLSANYKLIDNDSIVFKASIGFNYNQTRESYLLKEGSELIAENMVNIGNATEVEELSSLFENKRAGGYLNVDFSYMNYLQMTGSIRQDYSNKFGDDTNGFLSYGVGLDFSIVRFLNEYRSIFPYDIILNASYGKFGNEFLSGSQIGRYQASVVSGDGFISEILENGLELNPATSSINLLAESTSGFDLGFDILSNQRLRMSVRYYNEISEGVITNRALAASSGNSILQDNIGTVSNKGYDVNFSVQPVVRKNLGWKLDVNFNKNNNLLEKLNDTEDEIFLSGFDDASSVAKVGSPLGVLIGGTFLRNEEGLMIIGENGFPLVDSEKKIIGDPNPDWTMFVRNEFRIGRNLSLSALVDFKQGGDMWCGTCGTLDYFGRSEISAELRGESVVFEGLTETGADNNISVELAPESGSSSEYFLVRYGFGGIGEMSIYDASWIRLRNLTLSYDLSNIKGLNIFSELTCSLFAQNLWMLTEYPGIDPETNLTGNGTGFGIDYYNNPGTKTFGFNLKATF